MNKETFDEFVNNRYKTEIDWYDKKAMYNRRAYQIFQWSAIILAALTPLLIAIDFAWSKWVAIGVAVLVAIATSALKAFKYQELWINYRTTCETLRKEIYYYEAGIHGYESVDDKEAAFVNRVENLVSRENTLWVTTQEKEEQIKRK